MSEVKVEVKTLDDLQPDPSNINRHTVRGHQLVENSLRRRGAFRSIAAAGKGVDKPVVMAGNLTIEKARDAGFEEVIFVHTNGRQLVSVIRDDIEPGSAEAIALGLEDNESTAKSYSPDIDVLAALAAGDNAILAALRAEDKVFNSLIEGMGLREETKDAPVVDEGKADAMREKWKTELGQYWQLGEHRLFIGDSAFDVAGVTRLFDGRKAVLVHADPPYGMGKESEGIANDNLYREKLDLFQMAWWRACRPHLEDNGSAYIWGQAEDLWRLWYCGGLRDSERLTFRNEIVWEKQGAQGIGSEAHRQYPTASERCLFFMLGEQGFNVNASNYWEGWTPIIEYLESQRQLAGWSIKDTKRIAGHSEQSGCHWFDKSQWSMPTREVYEAWQRKAESSDAFKREYDELKREYDELKREFYSTRAHFDNTHDNMTDVWHFPRVTGDDRMGHATPKPVEMSERIIKSSSPAGGLVYAPFLGTAPDLIACENLGRICYGADVDAGYAALAIERYTQAFPGKTVRKL